jgi:NAD(P)-dependent dehydrogenase (short-subunit alcohol dehydrogenase family)
VQRPMSVAGFSLPIMTDIAADRYSLSEDPKPLKGRIAIVSGASRGAGRGIAMELANSGAIVYCTGRSVRGDTTGRPESIDETVDLIRDAGGTAIALRADHTDPKQVEAVFGRIDEERDGRLDIVVNDIWGGDELTEWGRPFWEHSLEKGLRMLERAVSTHLITSHYAVPLLVARRGGVVFEITDGKTYDYRGSFYYDLAKTAAMRMAMTMADELRPHGVAAIAVTPGFLRSEAMLGDLDESNWREKIQEDRFFAFSETPRYIGRAVAALAADPSIMARSGRTLATWDLAEQYGFTDTDGTQPHWERNFKTESLRDETGPGES